MDSHELGNIGKDIGAKENGKDADLDVSQDVNKCMQDSMLAERGSDEESIPSPTIFDDVPVKQNHTVPVSEASGDRTVPVQELEDGEPSAKKARPSSPVDVKPDLATLEALVKKEPFNVVSVKLEEIKAEVKTENNAEDIGEASGNSADSDQAKQSPSQSPQKPSGPPPCMYGDKCYRRNPQHREQFSHPGDSSWRAPDACPWGAACYRRSQQHRTAFSHPGPPADRPGPPQPVPAVKKKRAAAKKAAKKKKPDWSGTDSEDEYDMEDPFLADDSSDDYQPESSSNSSFDEDA